MQWPIELAQSAISKWERMKGFHLGAVDQRVRLAFGERDFPKAWGPGGHRQRQEVLAFSADLERRGLATVQRTGRGAFGAPKAVVLEPEAVEAAYRAVRTPSRRAHVRSLLESLPIEAPTEWGRAYLERLHEELSRGEASVLGRGARDVTATPDVSDALKAALAISAPGSYDERTLSGALFGQTKRILELRPRIRQILLSADPFWADQEENPSDRVLFGHYGELNSPSIHLVAAGTQIPGVANLAEFRPYAALLPDQLRLLGDAVAKKSARPTITTIENLTSFLRYLDEEGRRGAIEREEEIVLYTEGFPSPDLLQFLQSARPAAREVRHWGDTDVYGIRIGLQVASAAGEAQWWRMDGGWILRTRETLGQPLTEGHRNDLEQLLEHSGLDALKGGAEAIRATLQRGIWFEQEVHATASEVVAMEAEQELSESTR